MAISYVGGATASATSIPSLPNGRQLLDLEIIWAFNSAAATAPTVPSGWKRISNITGNACGMVGAYRWCTSTSDTSGGWTNATQLICEVYRGVYGVGDSETFNGAGVTIAYPANFPAQTAGNGWIIAAAGHRTATSLGTTPAGLTARSSVGANPLLASLDTNGGVASFAQKTSTANASGGNCGLTVELLADNSTWDPSARGGAGEFTLSSDDLTAWLTTTPAAATIAFGSLGRVAGQFVYKVTSGDLTSGLSIGLGGNGNGSATLGGSTSSVAWSMTGGVTLNGSSVGTAAAWGAGAALYVAVDFANALIWFRAGAGSWNNSGSADPDAGAGGFSISALSLANAICPARGAAAGVGTETTGFVYDGAASGHGLSTFRAWDTLSSGVAGALAATEDADAAAMAGLTALFGSLASTESSDTAALAAQAVAGASGTLSVTEAADASTFAGQLIVAGGLAATESADSASFVISVPAIGVLSVAEAADIAGLAGVAPASWGPQSPAYCTWAPQTLATEDWVAADASAADWRPAS